MLSRSKQEQRKKEFKKGIDADDSRRKRGEFNNDIRKAKREETMQKRRNVDPPSTASQISTSEISVNPHDIPAYAQNIMSGDPATRLQAATQFRKLLSIEKNPPIQEVIQSGAVPIFIQYLSTNDTKLQLECAWALTNIASGTSEQTQLVVQLGAIPLFIQLLASGDAELREQAVWAIGNIAGDSPQCRDFVLKNQGLQGILHVLSLPGQKLSLIRNATWTLSNLCRGKPQPPFAWVSPCLPVLAQLLGHNDSEIVCDACWALSYISDGSNDNIQGVLDAGVAPRLLELLKDASTPSIQTPALRTLGNIVTGSDEQAQIVLDLQALTVFNQLLFSPKKNIRKETVWAISNITAGNRRQTQHVIDSNVMPRVVQICMTGEFDVKKEAAWALSNATTHNDFNQISYLVNCGCLQPLCQLLSCKDTKMIEVALEAIEHILQAEAKHNSQKGTSSKKWCDMFEEEEGIDKLEELQMHENESIYQRAVRLLETYFGGEEDDTENMVPNVVETNGHQAFAFTPIQAPTTGFAF